MIKLTIHPQGNPEIRCFNQESVVIGCQDSSEADLHLSDARLSCRHIQIFKQSGEFFIVNSANDPFVTLNGRSFGKKKLKNQDLIRIRDIEILVEAGNEDDACLQKQSKQKDAIVDEDLDLKQQAQAGRELKSQMLLKPFENIPKDHLESLLASVEQLKKDSFSPNDLNLPQEKLSVCIEKSEGIALEKNLPNHKIDPEEERRAEAKEDASSHDEDAEVEQVEEVTHWSFFYKTVLTMFVFATLLGMLGFLSEREKNCQDRKKTAEGVADIAMTLAYAQVYENKQSKQNWFDSEFLKAHLPLVLPSTFETFAKIDHQGRFNEMPYILRIYTSSNLSRFLVIAQPEATFFEWVLPKGAIAIDSEAMEMRLITDLKGLNRLLAGQSVLDTPRAKEISRIVASGKLLSLNNLSEKKIGGFSFTPPTSLSRTFPGAENKIYNAPRYYLFGEKFLQEVLAFKNEKESSVHSYDLKKKIAALIKFPNLVLYSSEGIQKALQAQKQLAAFSPLNRFLTAYIKFDERGRIRGSQLLLNNSYAQFFPKQEFIPQFKKSQINKGFLVKNASTEIAIRSFERPLLNPVHSNTADHPILLELSNLAAQKREGLKPKTSELVSLLYDNLEQVSEDFQKVFDASLTSYYVEISLQTKKAAAELKKLYQEYFLDLSLFDFIRYTQSFHLKSELKEMIEEYKESNESSEQQLKKIDDRLETIQSAKSFCELDEKVQEAKEVLTLEFYPDVEKLIELQKEMRTAVLRKLKEFILSLNSGIAMTEFNEASRNALIHVLKQSWVIDPVEHDFYLKEFDLLMNSH